MAICDEAHYLKSAKAQRSKNLIPILTRMKRLMLLSGTPILARPIELYNSLTMLRPDIFHDFFRYATRYCDPSEGKFGPDYSGADHIKELHYLLEQKMMIRRLKKHVLNELPPKLRQKVPVTCDKSALREIAIALNKELSDEQAKEQLEVEAKRRAELFENAEKDSQGLCKEVAMLEENNDANNPFKQQVNLGRAYQLTGLAKIPGILEVIDTMLESGTKFILFAHHFVVMDAVEAHVKTKKFDYMRIDGQTSGDKRHANVKKFQCDDDCRIAICSITAASLGVTMTAASTVVFAEMHWTPAQML